MKWRYFFLTVAAILTLSSCGTGGFLDEAVNVHTGVYEKRNAEKNKAIDRQQKEHLALLSESDRLTTWSREYEQLLAQEQYRVAAMEKRLERLVSKIRTLTGQYADSTIDINTLKDKISTCQTRLTRQKSAVSAMEQGLVDPARIRMLEQERDELKKEYKALLEYSQAIVNTVD